ncbi:MAG: hypothetical protein RIS70_3285 [Planctomycetota bacterium]
MNYLAHARHLLHDPYLTAGVAVPDWLRVVDRTNRVRSKHAEPHVDHPQPEIAAVARGIVQHHRDDAWFHETRAFVELSLEFSRRTRETLGPDDSLRPSFVGHILVEILLDANLAAADPSLLDRYYQAMASIQPLLVEEAVNQMAVRQTTQLAAWIPRFCAARFLYDYAEDAKLLWRLNMVMKRVGLPELAPSFCSLLPAARRLVRERQAELLTGETA